MIVSLIKKVFLLTFSKGFQLGTYAWNVRSKARITRAASSICKTLGIAIWMPMTKGSILDTMIMQEGTLWKMIETNMNLQLTNLQNSKLLISKASYPDLRSLILPRLVRALKLLTKAIPFLSLTFLKISISCQWALLQRATSSMGWRKLKHLHKPIRRIIKLVENFWKLATAKR